MSEPMVFSSESGKYADHEVVRVEVLVCRDQLGRIHSSHNLASALDREIALTWPSGGQEEVAFAILTEAVRREALFTMLLLMSRDPETVIGLEKLPENERNVEIDRLAKLVATQVAAAAAAIAPDALRDALRAITDKRP